MFTRRCGSLITVGLSGLLAFVALQTSACQDKGFPPDAPKVSTTTQGSTISCLGADDCAPGQDCVCDIGGCSCGTATDSKCDECEGDGDCGGGQCCYQGQCVGASDGCACGEVAFTGGGSDSAGCPDAQNLIEQVKAQARSQCPSACGAGSDGTCGSGSASCDCTDGFPSENVVCENHTETIPGDDTGGCGSGSGSGTNCGSGSGSSTFTYATMIATVCSLCAGPPLPDDPCDDLRVQVNAKQMEITSISRDIALLTKERDANAAARDSYQAQVNALNGLETKLETGQFGNNILVTTAAHSTSMVTDVIAIGKAAKLANGIKCTGTKVCNIIKINRKRPGTMAIGHTLKSDVTANAVYTPATDMVMAKLGGTAANTQCPAPPPEDSSWADWVPLYKDSTWLIGCYTAQFRTAEVGENRTHAINSRNFYAAKVTQLEAQIATKNQALGVAKAALAQLQAQLDQCVGQCAADSRCLQLQTLIGLWNDVLTSFACDQVPPLDQDECDNAQSQLDTYQAEYNQSCGGGGGGGGGSGSN